MRSQSATIPGSAIPLDRTTTRHAGLAVLRVLGLALLVSLLLTIAPASAQDRGVFQEGESAEDVIDDARSNELNFVFQNIVSATNDGLENLIPILNVLLASLLIISLILTFMFGAFQEDFSPLVTLLKKAIVVGFILFFIQEWQGLRDALLDGAAQIGLISGNSDLTSGAVLNPGRIAGRGFGLALAVIARVVDLSGPIAFFNNLSHIFIYLLAGTVILVAFAILSITVFVALAEFYIGTTVAVILFPLGVLRATSFAAQSAFGYVIASAVKIIVLGVIIGLATSIFIDPLFDQEPDPLQGEAMGIAFISIAIAVVAWSASSLAAGLVQGGPALGAGAAVGPAVSAAAGGVAIGAGSLAGARALSAMAGQAGGATSGGAFSGGGGGGGGGPALSGPSSRLTLGGPSGAPALPKPTIAGLLPPPGGGSGSASSSGGTPGPSAPSGGNTPNLPAVAGQSLPARAGQWPPALAGQSLPATAGHASTMSAGGGGPGADSGGGASAARAYMAKPAPPPAGEGKGGRGNGRGSGLAGAYAAQQAVMADRGGAGYRGPDLERD